MHFFHSLYQLQFITRKKNTSYGLRNTPHGPKCKIVVLSSSLIKHEAQIEENAITTYLKRRNTPSGPHLWRLQELEISLFVKECKIKESYLIYLIQRFIYRICYVFFVSQIYARNLSRNFFGMPDGTLFPLIINVDKNQRFFSFTNVKECKELYPIYLIQRFIC